MKYYRCTRCDLNYRTEEEEYCKICIKEMQGASEEEEDIEIDDICPFCEENALPYGEEMCEKCAASHKKSEEAPTKVMTKISYIEIE